MKTLRNVLSMAFLTTMIIGAKYVDSNEGSFFMCSAGLVLEELHVN